MVASAAVAGSVDEHDQTDGEYAIQDNETAPAEEPVDTGENVSDNETGAEEPVDEPNDTIEEDGGAASQGAYVNFSAQTTAGETVVVNNVTTASGGFVTIHDSSLLVGNVFESVIGTSEYLEPGTHDNVTVTLDEPLEEDETLIAMPHRDTNDNETYDFVDSEGADDPPYLTADDEPVTDDAVVSISGADEAPVEEEPVNETPTEEEPVEEEPVNETPTEEEPVEEEPVNETPTEEEPVEEEPVEEEPAEEEPVNETPTEEEPVEEEPAEEEPAEEEPVEEEPPADEEPPAEEAPTEDGDGEINVVIEQATIFVFISELPDNVSASENMSGVEMDGITVDAGNHTAVDSNDTAAHANVTSDLEITLDEVSVASSNGDHTAMGQASDQTDQRSAASFQGSVEVVIEQATIYVFVGDIGAEQPVNETPTEEPPAAEEPPVEEPPAEEEPVNETPVDEEPAEEEPVNETPTEEEPVNETPVNEEPAEEEPTNETPTEEEPVNETPVDEEPANETPTEEEPVNDTPVEEEPVNETPTEEEPVNDTPVEEEPVNDTPAEEEPVNDTPAEEEPVNDTPVEEPPAEEEPADSFTVENLDAPATAEAGETFTVSATISNPTEEERTESVQFRLDGDLITTEEVTLAPGETAQVEFEVNTADLGLEAGQYVHMVLSDFSGEVATLELTTATDDGGLEGDLENDTETNATNGTGADNATAAS
ncbi:DUF7282 domain-containing protein [Haloterrigena alkaliphila]|uniref:DUF7282 domain-containing protein n=1 Tax=Haloterrigena alkaliphila TaxID=2816475 RepID=UPI001CFFB97D|nr:hypothetical protein [Haloterrigena alkaliphila]UHQ95406.1 hypothetical protein J0X25_20535 [Haloterrigena alkaliphila]